MDAGIEADDDGGGPDVSSPADREDLRRMMASVARRDAEMTSMAPGAQKMPSQAVAYGGPLVSSQQTRHPASRKDFHLNQSDGRASPDPLLQQAWGNSFDDSQLSVQDPSRNVAPVNLPPARRRQLSFPPNLSFGEESFSLVQEPTPPGGLKAHPTRQGPYSQAPAEGPNLARKPSLSDPRAFSNAFDGSYRLPLNSFTPLQPGARAVPSPFQFEGSDASRSFPPRQLPSSSRSVPRDTLQYPAQAPGPDDTDASALLNQWAPPSSVPLQWSTSAEQFRPGSLEQRHPARDWRSCNGNGLEMERNFKVMNGFVPRQPLPYAQGVQGELGFRRSEIRGRQKRPRSHSLFVEPLHATAALTNGMTVESLKSASERGQGAAIYNHLTPSMPQRYGPHLSSVQQQHGNLVRRLFTESSQNQISQGTDAYNSHPGTPERGPLVRPSTKTLAPRTTSEMRRRGGRWALLADLADQERLKFERSPDVAFVSKPVSDILFLIRVISKIQPSLNQTCIARLAEVNRTSLSLYMNHKFTGDKEVLEGKLAKFINAYANGILDRKPNGEASSGPTSNVPFLSRMTQQVSPSETGTLLYHTSAGNRYSSSMSLLGSTNKAPTAGTPQILYGRTDFGPTGPANSGSSPAPVDLRAFPDQNNSPAATVGLAAFPSENSAGVQGSPEIGAGPVEAESVPKHPRTGDPPAQKSLSQKDKLLVTDRAFHAFVASRWARDYAFTPPLLFPINIYVRVGDQVLDTVAQWQVGEQVLSPEVLADKLRRDYRLPETFVLPVARFIRTRLAEAGISCAPPPFAKGRENRHMIRISVPLPFPVFESTAASGSESSDEDDADGKSQGGVVLKDEFEWDLGAEDLNHPEEFSVSLCADAGVDGRNAAAVARAIREQVVALQAACYATENPSVEALPEVKDVVKRRSQEDKKLARRKRLERMVEEVFVEDIICGIFEEERNRVMAANRLKAEKAKKEREENEKKIRMLESRKAQKERKKKETERRNRDEQISKELGVDIKQYTSRVLGKGRNPGVFIPLLRTADKDKREEGLFGTDYSEKKEADLTPAKRSTTASVAETTGKSDKSLGKPDGRPVKRKRGRPPGVKNKKKRVAHLQSSPPLSRRSSSSGKHQNLVRSSTPRDGVRKTTRGKRRRRTSLTAAAVSESYSAKAEALSNCSSEKQQEEKEVATVLQPEGVETCADGEESRSTSDPSEPKCTIEEARASNGATETTNTVDGEQDVEAHASDGELEPGVNGKLGKESEGSSAGVAKDEKKKVETESARPNDLEDMMDDEILAIVDSPKSFRNGAVYGKVKKRRGKVAVDKSKTGGSQQDSNHIVSSTRN